MKFHFKTRKIYWTLAFLFCLCIFCNNGKKKGLGVCPINHCNGQKSRSFKESNFTKWHSKFHRTCCILLCKGKIVHQPMHQKRKKYWWRGEKYNALSWDIMWEESPIAWISLSQKWPNQTTNMLLAWKFCMPKWSLMSVDAPLRSLQNLQQFICALMERTMEWTLVDAML